jgi:hypothetical protein
MRRLFTALYFIGIVLVVDHFATDGRYTAHLWEQAHTQGKAFRYAIDRVVARLSGS